MSTDDEKLDIMNGFILSPLYDKLFDEGLITFTSDKQIHISPTLSKNTKKNLGLKECFIPELPVQGREEYLKFHNEIIFIK